jgi:hypothetical protein
MQLNLSNNEALVLRGIIQDHLPNLRRELAATDLPARELRNELHQRIDLYERMLSELRAATEKVSAR